MTQFTPSECAQFVAIADILICSDDIMPAASQAGIADLFNPVIQYGPIYRIPAK